MRWTEGRPARALGAGGVLAASVGALGVRPAAAQTPPGRPPAAARDTTRGPARDSARAGGRRALPDSASRDSIVAAQLRASRRDRPSLLARARIDRLRLTEIGGAVGVAFPDQVRSAPVYALRADYGEIVPGFRAVFEVSYWTSRYTDEAVAGFEAALGRAAGRPPGDPVRVGAVRSSDVVLAAETRWRPRFLGGRPGREGGTLRPWLALGAGLNFINVQNPALDGTFVARTLDGVALGPTGAVGLDVVARRAIRLMGEARYDLFNGARFGSVRFGGRYAFEGRRAP